MGLGASDLTGRGGSALTGRESVLTAAGGSDGSPTPVYPLTTLVWEYANDKLLAADNRDPKNVVVGAFDGTNLYGDGATVKVTFTTDGGIPDADQTVWLASYEDDSDTGIGKATATEPTTSGVYPPFPQNVVPVGTFVGGSFQLSTRTGLIQLSVPGRPNYTPPANVTYNLQRVTGTTGTQGDGKYFENAAAPGEARIGPGESLLVCVTLDVNTAGAGNDYVFGIDDGTHYMALGGDNTFHFAWDDGTLQDTLIGTPWPGANRVLISNVAGVIHITLNGQAEVVGAAAKTIPSSGGTLRFGNGTGWTRGGLLSFIKYNTTFANAAARQAISAIPVSRGDWFSPVASETSGNANCQWWCDLTTWTAGTNLAAQAGPAGTAFTMTRHTNGGGAGPVATAFSYTWDKNPASKFLDGPPPMYGSLYYPAHGEQQRIAFTVPTFFDLGFMAGFMVFNGDFVDNDETDFAVMVTGSEVAAPQIPFAVLTAGIADGTVRATYAMAYGSAPYDTLGPSTAPYKIQLVGGETISKRATFESAAWLTSFFYPSTATFETNTTGRRLTIIGEGDTWGGHSNDLVGQATASGSVTTRCRATYPGKISAFNCTAANTIAAMLSWGRGSIFPYADWLSQYIEQGAPGTVHVLENLGVLDWFRSTTDTWSPGTTLAVFTAQLPLLLDRIHANVPGAIIYGAMPVQTSLYPDDNGRGETLQQFVDAKTAIYAARAFVAVRDLATPAPPLSAPGFPSLSTAGAIQLAANTKGAAGIGW